MNDPRAGKYQRYYRAEFDKAKAVLDKHPGELTWGVHDYQAFVYTEPTVRLVFYPHKTSAWNYHIRVRNEGSKDTKRANQLIRELSASVIGCTFNEKNQYERRYDRGEKIHD